jgi:hypothetical protein
VVERRRLARERHRLEECHLSGGYQRGERKYGERIVDE